MDRVLHITTSNPGKALSTHSETLYAGKEFAEMRDYTRRYRHANCLCVVEMDEKPGYGHGISLYRAGQDEHYSSSDEHLLEQLMPHMVEALEQNRILTLCQTGAVEGDLIHGTRAIASYNGKLHYAGSGFNCLLREEWPGWKGGSLPEAVLVKLNRNGSTGYSGEFTDISATCIGQLIFLRAAPRCPLSRLSPREASIAKLFGRGQSHKEIAKQLNVSPVTVRNQIQRIYTKLHIGDKAELAVLISRKTLYE